MSVPLDKFIDGMITTVLTNIMGITTYEPIKILNDELTCNAFAIPTNLGCGIVRYSCLTLNHTVYANISIADWIPPSNLGVQAVIPTGATGIQITTINRTFDTDHAIYRSYVVVGNILKKLLAAVDDIYICSLKRPYISYGNVTVLDLLNHLYTTYDGIFPSDLEKNNNQMIHNYDLNLSVKSLFKQIEDAVVYEDHGGAPLSPIQTVNRAFTLVLKTGIFVDDCKEWKRLPNV